MKFLPEVKVGFFKLYIKIPAISYCPDNCQCTLIYHQDRPH